MSSAHLGKKNSEEHNKHISEAKVGVKTGFVPRSAFKKGEYTEAMRKGSFAGAEARWEGHTKVEGSYGDD